LIAFSVVVAVTISITTPAFAEYDTSSVYTMIGKDKYYMNGTKLMKGKAKVVNFRDLTYDYGGTKITEDMMKTLLVTALTHEKYNGHEIIYAAGLVFEPKQDKVTSSENFRNQTIKIGTPYMVIMSYCLDGPTKDIPWYKGNYLMMEGTLKYDEMWDAALDSILDESKDPTEDETYDTLYNFAAKIAHPRIIMSKYYEHRAYLLAQDCKPDRKAADSLQNLLIKNKEEANTQK